MLANKVIRDIHPHAVTIAEDVSGMPTLCRTIQDGGIGFDYRLNMFLPDLWIKLLKETKDEFWNMGHLCHSMTNRRWKEKCVGYAESHDQAIVGDKTISQWLFDAEVYSGMGNAQRRSIRVDRGMGLHKMIRLLTQSLGGQAYLNFMGNEFGHPEWIDFPREGNNFSYHYCRRQWNLVDDKNLLFQCLNNFDREMNKWERVFQVMESEDLYVTSKHEEDKVIIFEKGKLLFAFNFNPTKSFENYRVGTQWASDHVILYDTDSKEFGGNCRLDQGKKNRFVPTKGLWQHRTNSIRIYLPNRTAIVFVAQENITEQALQNGVFIPATIEAHA